MVLACGIFKGIQSRHLLLLFLVIDLTRTRVLWCRNRLFCQLVHNHCPTMQMFKGSSSRCTSSLMIKNCCVASFVRSFVRRKQTNLFSIMIVLRPQIKLQPQPREFEDKFDAVHVRAVSFLFPRRKISQNIL